MRVRPRQPGGPQPVYLSNLAACLLKLEQWEVADSAASRALVYDLMHVKALYRWAVARRELARLKAALAGAYYMRHPLSLSPSRRPS